MLMEQTPSQQNWAPYNSLKKPGHMRAQSYQSIAHGADTVQFFHLRRSVGAYEKFHGAVIEHVGTGNTRVFREVAELGKELEELDNQILGTSNPAQVGIIFDWDNYWALEYTSGPNKDLKYVDQIHQYYRYFYDKNIPVDMIPVDADFSKYKIVVAPVLYMVKEGMQQSLETFVKNGGVFVTGFMSGIVDQSDNVHLGGYPGPLRKMAGVWVEEIDALAPEQSNTIRFVDGTTAICRLLCDIIHTEEAESLVDYSSNFYAGLPAVTRNSYGKGYVFYIGTELESKALDKVMDHVTTASGVIPLTAEPTKLEVVCRESNDGKLWFIMNFTDEELPLPQEFAHKKDLLTGKELSAETKLVKYDVYLISTL